MISINKKIKHFQDIGIIMNFIKLNPLNYNLNLKLLKVFKYVLVNNSEILNEFDQNNGSEVLIHLILQIYQSG